MLWISKTTLSKALLATVLLMPSVFNPAFAANEDETVTWNGDVRGWAIMVDRTVGNGCFMITSYEKGTILRAQFFPKDRDFGFLVGDANWKSLEDGKLYETAVKFGNRTPWTGDAQGLWIGETPFLVLRVPFEDDKAEDFIAEFMKMTVVDVEYEGESIATLKLTGTYAAMQETINCQVQMDESQSSADPFSSSGTDDADPFN